MAKKIRKRRPSFARALAFLLIPWVVMGLTVYAALSAGAQEPVAYGAALAAALAVTFLIHLYLRKGRPRA